LVTLFYFFFMPQVVLALYWLNFMVFGPIVEFSFNYV
jgi:hypothetical protein